MIFDRRITLGNILTILSFVAIGLIFVITTRTTSVEAAESVRNLAPRVSANTQAVRNLQIISENRSEDMKYLTAVVRSIAVKVDAEIPIKEPTN